jgi:hypothetical protein
MSRKQSAQVRENILQHTGISSERRTRKSPIIAAHEAHGQVQVYLRMIYGVVLALGVHPDSVSQGAVDGVDREGMVPTENTSKAVGRRAGARELKGGEAHSVHSVISR